MQQIREDVDKMLLSDPDNENLLTFRGSGTAGNPDVLYGSIYDTPVDQESIVRLQHKFLFLLNLLQGADARPTTQTIEAVGILQESLTGIQERWGQLK